MITKLKKDILDLIFPPKCIICERIGDFVCSDCFSLVVPIKSPVCPFCHRLSCLGATCKNCRRKYKLSGVFAYSHFGNPVMRELIHDFKYGNLAGAADFLAALIAPIVRCSEREYDLVAYVPASKKRLSQRGYNQSAVLAKSLAALLDLSVYRGLKKSRDVRSQVGLKRKERLVNLENIFVAQNRDALAGRRVLLVDDVLTTGTTLNECAKTLKRAGAREVWGVVIARE